MPHSHSQHPQGHIPLKTFYTNAKTEPEETDDIASRQCGPHNGDAVSSQADLPNDYDLDDYGMPSFQPQGASDLDTSNIDCVDVFLEDWSTLQPPADSDSDDDSDDHPTVDLGTGCKQDGGNDPAASLPAEQDSEWGPPPSVSAHPDAINILVLGETGVGKSTLINAIANYLSFDSFEDALASDEPITLVPARFTLCDSETFEDVIVESKTIDLKNPGRVVHETARLAAGQSGTPFPQSYVFCLNDGAGTPTKIRIIDTPGMGDTRGIAQDKINMDNIVRYASWIGSIHAIVLALPTNNSHLTVWFRLCILELLQNFDRAAIESMVFLFTKARVTYFRMGDTTIALEKFFQQIREESGVDIQIREDNIFLVDNEAYRFLLARQSVDFLQSEIEGIQESWNKSAETVRRLLALAQAKGPQDLRLTAQLRKLRTFARKQTRALIETPQEPHVRRSLKLLIACTYYLRLHSIFVKQEAFLDLEDLDEIKWQAYGDDVIDLEKLGMLKDLKDMYDIEKALSSFDDEETAPPPSLDDIVTQIERLERGEDIVLAELTISPTLIRKIHRQHE